MSSSTTTREVFFFRVVDLTGISIFKTQLIRRKSAIDDWFQRSIKLSSAIQCREIVLTRKILIRANLCLSTITRTLQPTTIFTARTRSDQIHGNQLVTIHGSGDISAIAQSLGAQCGAHGRVESL